MTSQQVSVVVHEIVAITTNLRGLEFLSTDKRIRQVLQRQQERLMKLREQLLKEETCRQS